MSEIAFNGTRVSEVLPKAEFGAKRPRAAKSDTRFLCDRCGIYCFSVSKVPVVPSLKHTMCESSYDINGKCITIMINGSETLEMDCDFLDVWLNDFLSQLFI